MRTQPRPLRLRQPPVELERERPLGRAARERAVELLPQRPARAEEQRLHRGHAQPQLARDLRVRPPLELAHHERLPLRRDELVERAADLGGAPPRLLLLGRHVDRLVEADLLDPAPARHEPPALVARDPQEPVARQPHPLAAEQRAVGADEDLLRDVLGVRRLAEPAAAVPQDLAAVAAVERSARLVGARGRPVDGGNWASRHDTENVRAPRPGTGAALDATARRSRARACGSARGWGGRARRARPP